jgi:hypothetical protein
MDKLCLGFLGGGLLIALVLAVLILGGLPSCEVVPPMQQ